MSSKDKATLTSWLRCCPFCGSSSVNCEFLNYVDKQYWNVACSKCGAGIAYDVDGPFSITRAEYEKKKEKVRLLTIAAWNRRDYDENYDEE